ncbi:hypothetical protein C5167_011557 [Papaver somniferum]|uniref:C2 domain-containing protein n=1 Tax=Papaver somniferum TaxID=3469 RepID=A0A4Y7K6L9_PAPSO|nr:hypothetical protein C5167_011557 [Papaver somniferum]
MDVQADMWCDIKQIKQILVGVVTLFDHKLDLLRTEIGTSTSTMNAGATDGDPGKMDPYVIIQFCNQKGKSTVARGKGKAPVWNEKFTFDVEYPDNIRDEHHQYKLDLTIMDKDRFSTDDFVGEWT